MQVTLDYKQIPAVPYDRTVVAINNFVIHTTQFVNNFSTLCERKLSEVSRQIERLEITLSLLEAKLSSIPGLEGAAPSSSQAPASSSAADDNTAAPPPPPPIPEGGVTIGLTPAGAAAEAPVMRVRDDPRMAEFFKMERLGVPKQLIKMKMQTMGLNPDLLDTPDAPAESAGGGGGRAPISRSASFVSNAADDDEEEEEADQDAGNSAASPPPPPSGPPMPPPPPPGPPGLPAVGGSDDEEEEDE